MNTDYISITDPPEFPTHYEADDLPEALGEETITAEEDAHLDRAAQYGITLLRLGKGRKPESRSARQALRNLGLAYWQNGRRTIIPTRCSRHA